MVLFTEPQDRNFWWSAGHFMDVIRERLKSLRHIICHVMMLYILSDRHGMVEEIEKRNFLLTDILIL